MLGTIRRPRLTLKSVLGRGSNNGSSKVHKEGNGNGDTVYVNGGSTPANHTRPHPNPLSGRQGCSPVNGNTLVQWHKPFRPVFFRDWYIFHYCHECQVQYLVEMQKLGGPLQWLLTLYFHLWSFTGEAEFYILFLPALEWLGLPLDALNLASMLCMGQYVTGTIKDAICCPRPPCPPLQLRGKRETHDTEYGFPSTHSCQAGVFAYFLYCELLQFFPQHGFYCWLAAAFFFVNVSFSRIYLGMHWFGDLVGGWLVAFICILFHAAFVNEWEARLVNLRDAPWWAFALLYAALHLLAAVHRVPHDPCPCYLDSLRFNGALAGSIAGFWLFVRQYGELTARPRPDVIVDVAFSWPYFVQSVMCVIVVAVGRELTSLVAGKLLRPLFTFLSGADAEHVRPAVLRRLYLGMARIVGYTTGGNEHGVRRFEPITANNSFPFLRSNSESALGASVTGQAVTLAATVAVESKDADNSGALAAALGRSPEKSVGCGCPLDARPRAVEARRLPSTPTPQHHEMGKSGIAVPQDGAATVAVAVNEHIVEGEDSGHDAGPAYVYVCSKASNHTVNAAPADVIEEPDGYLNSWQVWSLRTHVHWWVWDAHRRSCSYFVTGLFCTYICPMLLRELFGVGSGSSAKLA